MYRVCSFETKPNERKQGFVVFKTCEYVLTLETFCIILLHPFWLLFWSQLSMNLDLFFRLIKFLFTLRYRKALNKFTWDKRKVLRFYWYFYLFSFMSLRLFLVRPVALKSGVWELYLAQICIQLYANISSHVSTHSSLM